MSVKKRPGLFFAIELRPYRYGLVVSIGQTDAEIGAAMAKMDRTHGTKRGPDVMEALETVGPGFCVVWDSDSFVYIRDIPDTVQAQGVVVHELLHAVRHCMKVRSISMGDMNGQEAHCYLLEETWNEVMGRVARHIRRDDKPRCR